MLKYRDWEEERIKIQLMAGPVSIGDSNGPMSSSNNNASGNGRGDQQDQSNEGFLDKQFMPNMENYGPGTP